MQAGFASPAEDHATKRIDVLEHIVRHPQAAARRLSRVKQPGRFTLTTLSAKLMVLEFRNDFRSRGFNELGLSAAYRAASISINLSCLALKHKADGCCAMVVGNEFKHLPS